MHQFYVFIKAFLVKKKGTKTVLSRSVLSRVAKLRSVTPRTSDVCTENLSHSAQLLLQQSRASYMPTLCLRAVLILSPDTWDWTRMHALAVMHRQTLCENVDSAKIKVSSYIVSIYRCHWQIILLVLNKNSLIFVFWKQEQFYLSRKFFLI